MIGVATALVVLMFGIADVRAHGADVADASSPAPWLLASIVVAAVLYARGVAALWTEAGRGHGVRTAAAATFLAGLAMLALLVSEGVERWTTTSFAAHMIQHELLMLVVAPMLVAGRPLAAWTWALPASWRGRVAHRFDLPIWRVPWRALTSPLGATSFQLFLLIGWHVPAAFDAAVAHPWVHALQHLSFLVPSLAFWWTVMGAGARERVGVVVLALFVTMLGTGALGALLTFATRTFYAGYAGGDALADQQLGGLIMWVPGGTAYLVVALGLLARWLGGERHAAAPPLADR